ncbi:MAG: ABC transporter permease [Actinomycetales bacterium]
MPSLRIFFVGGWMSYRALFGWLSPWILIPTFIIEPIFQILFFVYIGRDAGVGSDAFFLVGNAIQFASIPCLFAMGNTISGERYTQTLGLLLVSPARRIPLFLGRALPVILNGLLCSLLALGLGALILRVSLPVGSLGLLVLVVAVSSFACTGLGLVTAALALRVRETAVLSNLVMGVLLIFCGVNVALSALPDWMATLGRLLPLTHGIEAGRDLVRGQGWGQVAALLGDEALVGLVYVVIGLAMLAWFEVESRRRATLDRA